MRHSKAWVINNVWTNGADLPDNFWDVLYLFFDTDNLFKDIVESVINIVGFGESYKAELILQSP